MSQLLQTTIVPDKADYCTTTKIPEHFDGIGIKSAYKLVAEMYTHPKFSEGVAKPTSRITIVNKSMFWEFLKFKEEERFK